MAAGHRLCAATGDDVTGLAELLAFVAGVERAGLAGTRRSLVLISFDLRWHLIMVTVSPPDLTVAERMPRLV
jgi:hypothetical protein